MMMNNLRSVRYQSLGYYELRQKRLQIDFDEGLNSGLVDSIRVAGFPIGSKMLSKWLVLQGLHTEKRLFPHHDRSAAYLDRE
jgi:hypothetical protein